MDVVDTMACVDTVKDDDGNDTYRPTEEAAITINSVTITTYSSAEDNGLDTVADIRQYMQTRPRKFLADMPKFAGAGCVLCYLQRLPPRGKLSPKVTDEAEFPGATR